MTPKSVPGQVNVRLVLDQVPDMGRHRVTLLDDDGVVWWLTGGPCPETMQFAPGEALIAQASIAARRGAASTARPSGEWQLRVAHGGRAVLRLGTRERFRPFDGLEMHVEGARLARRSAPA